MSRYSLRTLKIVAGVGGVLSIFGAGACYVAIQNNLRSGSYFSKSLEIFRSHPVAHELIGSPLATKFLDLGDKFNYVKDKRAELAIPVKGGKGKGTLYTWSTRTDPYADDWVVQKMQLKMKGSAVFIDLYPLSPIDKKEEEKS